MTKRWSYSTGERGRNRVRAYENPGGLILLEFHERSANGERHRKRISLKHHNRRKAKQQADELAARFGTEPLPSAGDVVTLETLFDIYIREVSPFKGEASQKHDRSCVEMFSGFFGRVREARTIGLRDWDRFIAERRAGTTGPSGAPVRNRQIEYDLKFLVAVFN